MRLVRVIHDSKKSFLCPRTDCSIFAPCDLAWRTGWKDHVHGRVIYVHASFTMISLLLVLTF